MSLFVMGIICSDTATAAATPPSHSLLLISSSTSLLDDDDDSRSGPVSILEGKEITSFGPKDNLFVVLLLLYAVGVSVVTVGVAVTKFPELSRGAAMLLLLLLPIIGIGTSVITDKGSIVCQFPLIINLIAEDYFLVVLDCGVGGIII